METADLLKRAKEDILRFLAEKREANSLKAIASEMEIPNSAISEAIKNLIEEELIVLEKDSVRLTKEGQAKAENILRNSRAIESYFQETRSKDEASKMAHILEHYIHEEVMGKIQRASAFKGKGVPLTECTLDEEGLIADVTITDYELFERMVSMGIFMGESIKFLYRIPNGVIVGIGGKMIALDKELAKEIKILASEKG